MIEIIAYMCAIASLVITLLHMWLASKSEMEVERRLRELEAKHAWLERVQARDYSYEQEGKS